MSIRPGRQRWAGPRRQTDAASRLYHTNRWKRASKEFLAKHPLCDECGRQGKVTPAEHTDHITPHRGDVGLFWDVSNWQPLCASCNAKKARRG